MEEEEKEEEEDEEKEEEEFAFRLEEPFRSTPLSPPFPLLELEEEHPLAPPDTPYDPLLPP